MWKLAQRIDWAPYEDTNKPEPEVWKTQDNPLADCSISHLKPAAMTLPNIEKTSDGVWKELLLKLFQNLANPDVEVMYNISFEDLKKALAREDYQLQDDFPDSVIEVIWRTKDDVSF
jgi:hypothetical protein